MRITRHRSRTMRESIRYDNRKERLLHVMVKASRYTAQKLNKSPTLFCHHYAPFIANKFDMAKFVYLAHMKQTRLYAYCRVHYPITVCKVYNKDGVHLYNTQYPSLLYDSELEVGTFDNNYETGAEYI